MSVDFVWILKLWSYDTKAKSRRNVVFKADFWLKATATITSHHHAHSNLIKFNSQGFNGKYIYKSELCKS